MAFERLQPGAANGFNEPAELWVEIGRAWAERADVYDTERIAAGDEYSSLRARFFVRSSALTRGLSSMDRLLADGRQWEIRGVKEAKGKRHELIEITAVTRSGG